MSKTKKDPKLSDRILNAILLKKVSKKISSDSCVGDENAWSATID